ncbi:MAG: transcriptional repressor [Nitrosarchaeum sp.]|nr:transcriptional repressor [Nitrosarchaeum sp.]
MEFRKIYDERKEKFLFVLADKICRTIIASTIDRAKSAIEISNENNISVATVYRKLEILLNNKIITPSAIISKEGKKIFFYKAHISHIQTCFDINGIEVKISNFPKIQENN